ncbi:HAD hydrolase-like protein [bacterium]|nr:HAD hydrolase-like protein [bacterium]
MKLLLFDIDGTLLMSGGAGRSALNRAFTHVYGFDNGFQNVSMMGRTDPLIVKEVLKKHRIPWEENRIRTFQQVYYQFLEQELAAPEPAKSLCPGITGLLKKLSADKKIVLGILTGNWERGAYLKLRHFQIEHYFKLGAYADDAAERVDLVPVALKRFEMLYGQSIPSHHVYVIGDTPLDIIAARPHKARTVGVATGYHNKESIQQENPDIVFESFQDVEEVAQYFRKS